MIYIGIDIGSTASKVAVMGDKEEKFVLPTGWSSKETILTIKEKLFENGIDWKETEDMDLVRRDTAFDGKDNDWMAFAMQQAEFYRNANQYIVNIKLDIEEIEQEISDLMDEIDSSNCNVAQGYKLFKRLKELRIQRKEKEKELQCLYILTERFDMSAMANECESNAYELERLLYPEETVDECDETQISEGDADAGTISKAV